MSSFQGFRGLFGTKKPAEKNTSEMSIGMPTNVVHDIHVGKNARGELEGIFLRIKSNFNQKILILM